MSSFATILLLLGFLWLLAGIALFLHWLYPRTGLTPLMMYLGAIAAVMQVQGLRAVEVSFSGFSFGLYGAVLLPVLLFGILIVYITNGSVRGRSTVLGIMLISGLVISFQALLYYLPQISNIEFTFLQTYSLRIIFASMITLGVNIIVLFLGYQSLSNLRHQYPSRFASGLALLLALFIDAVIFSALAFGSSDNRVSIFQSQIIEKVVAGLALWPLLAIYIFRVTPQLPDSAATSARPVLDLFTTNLKLESRARYHYNLLRTLSQINQLIVRSTDPNSLLEQACHSLVDLRKYHMVWIGTLDEKTGKLDFAAQAGFSEQQIEKYVHNSEMINFHLAGIGGQAITINDIGAHKKLDSSWQKMMLATDCQAVAILPMKYANRVLGILNVCMNRPNSLEEIEFELLQELANDLAYALVSLEARKQQVILESATETMQDGLLISDLHGEIIYANSILAQIVGVDSTRMPGTKIDDLFNPEQLKLIPDIYKKIRQEGTLIFDVPYKTANGRLTDISINATIVEDSLGKPKHLVANVHDISHLRKYERQLLTLNRLTGELVQIRDTQALMERILEISEDLLEANASAIYFVNSATGEITDTLTNNLALEYSQRIAQDYHGLPRETAGKTLLPVFVNDTLNDPEYGDRIHFMAEYKIRALLILPILFHNQPIGTLTVYYPEPQMFSESQLQLGLTLVQTLAIIIQNTRFNQAEQEQRQLAEALIQAASSLNSSLDLEFVLDQILEQVMRVVPCKAANILMIKKDYAYVRHHRGYEIFPKYFEKISSFKIPLSTPNIQKILINNKSMLITDTAKEQDWTVFPDGEWIKGHASVPLKVDHQIVGFLNIDSDIPSFFTSKTLQHLVLFTDHAATAIKNARLYYAEHKQRELAEALTQAAASMSSSLELADVLDHILEQTMRVVPCQAANIMLIKEEKVILTRHRGYEEFIEDTSFMDSMEFPMDWPGLQAMYTDGKPIFMTDTHSDDRWQPTSDADWVRSFIGIPLKIEQNIVGFLNLDSNKPNQLNEIFLPPLQTFANYASTAIKNARLYQSSHRHAEEMAALVTAASAVSGSLDYMQVLQVIATKMTNLLRIQACIILSYEPDQNSISFLVEHGLDNPELIVNWGQLNMTDHFPGTRNVLYNNTPFQLQANAPELTPVQRRFLQESRANTLLLLPLITQDRTIGLVVLLDETIGRVFNVREITLGLSLASHAATALENAQLYQQLQEYTAELEERVQRRTQALQEATDYIEGILASVPDAVFVLDHDNQLMRANQAGERLLAQAQSTGLDLFNPQLLQILEMSGSPDLRSILEVHERAYQALSSQLITNEDHSSGQIIVFRDVTRFRELDQMKNQFVSDVSHELRTPLTNLSLYLGLLSTVQDQDKQDEYILTLRRETERLTHLIEDLLTISRLEASKTRFQIRAVDLNQLLENLVCDRAILAAQRSIVLEFTPTDDLPLASVDKNMLTQALSNLLTNATNYTLPGGQIKVTLAQPETDWITIHILDTGVGIPVDEVDHIFDRFYRGSATHATGAEGTGLGLAISKEIIHRLGGRITIESTPGKGSAFTVWLKPAPDDPVP